MKRILIALLFLALGSNVFAKDGYKVQVQFTDLSDTAIFLAQYYGKPLPTVFTIDSVRVDARGKAAFVSNQRIAGGIYIIMIQGKQQFFELLLENGADFTVTASAKDLDGSLKFNNSPSNSHFLEYKSVLRNYSNQYRQLQTGLAKARTAADTGALRQQLHDAAEKVASYREQYIENYKGSLMAAIFRAIKSPRPPEGMERRPDGTIDSNFEFNYYRQHYWDNFDLTDERLVYTPLFEPKLDEYFNKVLFPSADTVIQAADWLLAQTRGHDEIFKYSLWWLAQNARNTKVMGMDEVFVHLVEKYFMNGDADWIDSTQLAQYIDRARKIAPNVIGNLAPDLELVDINNKRYSLHGVDAKYTLLVFWSPDCGGCRKMMPQIDSVYQQSLKQKGVKIFAVSTERDGRGWMDFVKKENLSDWIHVYDPGRKSNYTALYDVYGTPRIYLLDENKIIRGKNMDHTTIIPVLNLIALKKKNNQKS